MGRILRDFLTNLLAVCNMLPAAKPAKAEECEFCGGVKCFGACGAEGVFKKTRDFCGRLVRCEVNECRFACDDGNQVHFRRDSQAEQAILTACPDGARCRITAAVDNGVIAAVISVERLEPGPSSCSVSQKASPFSA